MNQLLPKANYSDENCAMQIPAGPLEQLQQRKEVLEAKLNKVNAALDSLTKNPELANVLQLVAKALY